MAKMQTPSMAELEARVAEITSEKGEIPRELIAPSSRLVEDLNVDSLTFIEIVMALEEEFGVVMPEGIEKKTAADGPVTVAALAKVVEQLSSQLQTPGSQEAPPSKSQ